MRMSTNGFRIQVILTTIEIFRSDVPAQVSLRKSVRDSGVVVTIADPTIARLASLN